MNRIIFDLGSYSAKSYRVSSDSVCSIGCKSWRLLESADPDREIETTLSSLLAMTMRIDEPVYAVGTEAMRRAPELSERVRYVCQLLGVEYETLSQSEEARLILKGIGGADPLDIINAGGGSIQIVAPSREQTDLLAFGISDLNQRFALNSAPADRRISEAVTWVADRLPRNLSAFIYTGGEKTYLKKLGVPLDGENCSAKDFFAMSESLAALTKDQLEKLSPFDPQWMGGAVASNCIVMAALKVAGVSTFRASDINIAHGLLANFRS